MTSKKEKVLAAATALLIILFALLQTLWLPAWERRQATYAAQQQDPLTQNLSTILPYQTAYVGNNSKVANLFYHLPLSENEVTFEIDSNAYALKVIYGAADFSLSPLERQRAILYNGACAFAMIGNLTQITFILPGEQYRFTRSQIDNAFGQDLRQLTENSQWSALIQTPLAENAFVQSFFTQDPL